MSYRLCRRCLPLNRSWTSMASTCSLSTITTIFPGFPGKTTTSASGSSSIFRVRPQPEEDLSNFESIHDLPNEAKVLIYGDELVSKALAYHLADSLGPNVVVINGNGPDYRRPSIDSALNSFVVNHMIVSNPRSSLLIKHSTELFNTTKTGAIYLAQTEERVKSLLRMISISKLFIPKESGTIELISPEEIKRKFDYLDTTKIKAGIYVPFDGVVQNQQAEEDRLERAAKEKGVQFFKDFILHKVHVNNDIISSVELIHPITNELARIRVEYFVNAANNFLSRNIGKCSPTRVRVPTLACEHQILQTHPFRLPNQSADEVMPIITDFDNRFTAFQRNDHSFCLTGYEKVSRIVRKLYKTPTRVYPVNTEVPTIPERWDNFSYILDPILNRLPSLREAHFRHLEACPENFAPDGRPLIGEVSEVRNYLIAAAVWPSLAGGTARLLEDIILKKPNSFAHDFWSLDPKRFISSHANRVFLFDRLREIPAKSRYNINFPTPHNSYQTGHGLRRSPLYYRLKEAGAYFTQIMGYERPAVYLEKEPEPYQKELEDCGMLVERVLETPSFGKPHWFDAVRKEYTACRESVALLDYSSFTKINITSANNEALEFLQYICTNDINIPLGSITVTGMQNANGGYESDVSILRLAPNHFFLIGPTESQARCLTWLRSHLVDNDRVSIQNVTNEYTAICVMGPYAKLLLSDSIATAAIATGNAVRDYISELDNFQFFTAKQLPIGTRNVPVLACNLTHTGELGFVLYMLNEEAVGCYETLLNAGAKYEVQHAGSIAVRALRIEKFFAFWGQDLDTTTTPLECGRGFRVHFEKDFIGREALLKQKEEGVQRRFVQLVLDTFDSDSETIWPWGGEPIYLAKTDDDEASIASSNINIDRPVGMTTTTTYGFTLGKQVCIGYIRHPDPNVAITNDFLLRSKFEVEIGGKRFLARINLHSPKLTDVSGTYTNKWPNVEKIGTSFNT